MKGCNYRYVDNNSMTKLKLKLLSVGLWRTRKFLDVIPCGLLGQGLAFAVGVQLLRFHPILLSESLCGVCPGTPWQRKNRLYRCVRHSINDVTGQSIPVGEEKTWNYILWLINIHSHELGIFCYQWAYNIII